MYCRVFLGKSFINRALFTTISIGKRFTKDHEWVDVDAATSMATVGITNYAQASLGDLVYIELPKVGNFYNKEDLMGVVESVKGASDVYAPLSGQVKEINEQVLKKPSLINAKPLSEGWICKMKFQNANELDALLTEVEYKKHCEESE